MREVFNAARTMSPAERTAYLDQECKDDISLRNEVAALLGHHVEDDAVPEGNVFRKLVGGWSGAAMPEHIGGYRITRCLGAGGMGIVHEAVQEGLGRSVAVKVLRSQLVADELRQRFIREGELLGRLQHPGVAQIIEAGITGAEQDSLPFLVMELVRGQPLVAYADERRLSATDRLRLLVKICDAVQHAHQKGVMHRDLKPGNILVDGLGQPKILDFGIARAVGADQSDPSLRTFTGQVMGTLAYMSPEQAGGDPEAVDTRTDVYSLGVIAFELLTGQLPYDVEGKSVPAALQVVAEKEPTRLGHLDTSLRGDLEVVVGKALAKERERRYQTAAELGAELSRILRDEPIQARPPTLGYQLRKFARRNRGLVIGAGVGIVSLLVGLVVAIVFAVSEQRQRTAAERALYLKSLGLIRSAYEVRDYSHAYTQLQQLGERGKDSFERRFLSALKDGGGKHIASLGRPPFLSYSLDGRWLGVRDTRRKTTTLYELATDRYVLPSGQPERPVVIEDGEVKVRFDIATGSLVWATGTRQSGVHMPLQRGFLRTPYGGLSRNGELLYIGHGSRWQVFDAQTGAVRFDQEEPEVDALHHLCADPDARWVAACDQKGLVVVRDARNGRVIDRFLSGLTRPALQFVQGTSVLFLLGLRSDADNTPPLWARSRDIEKRVFRKPEYEVPAGKDASRQPRPLRKLNGGGAVVSDDGHTWAVPAPVHQRRIMIVNSLSARLVKEVRSPRNFTWIALSPDGSQLAASCDDVVLLWDRGAVAPRFLGGQGYQVYRFLEAPQFSPDGSKLLALRRVAWDLRTWDVGPETCDTLQVGTDQDQYVYGLDWSPDGALLATGTWDGSVRLFDAITGKLLGVLTRMGCPIRCVVFSPDGEWLAVTGNRQRGRARDAQLRLLRVRTGEQVVELARKLRLGDQDAWHRAVFTADSRHLFVGNHGMTIRLLQIPSLKVEAVLKSANPMQLRLAPDGKRVFFGERNGRLAVWNPATGECRQLFKGRGEVQGLDVHPAGREVAFARMGAIHLLDLEASECRALPAHGRGEIFSVRYNPGGSRLVSGGRDGTVRLWDPEHGELLLELGRHGSATSAYRYVMTVAFSPDGTRVASASGDTTVRLWDTRSLWDRNRDADAERERQAKVQPVVRKAGADYEQELTDPADRRSARSVLLRLRLGGETGR